jgi:hypothetical protein
MGKEHVNQRVEVVVVPGTQGKTFGEEDREKIEKLVRDKLLLTTNEPYHKAQVEVEHGPDGSPKTLVVSMLRSHTYTADVVNVNVDAQYNVKSIEPFSVSEAT